MMESAEAPRLHPWPESGCCNLYRPTHSISPEPMPEPPPHPLLQPSLELSDAEIVRRVLGGEGELFELIMRRYNQRLYRILYGELGDRHEAEEVLQETWVRVYGHLATFRGEARLSTWLMRIALHEAWARRRRQRRFVVLDGEPEGPDGASLESSPERSAFGAELRAELERAVAAIGLPAILKTRRLGYDGKGQIVIRGEADIDGAWEELGGVPLILEGFVPFRRELSVLAVRGRPGANPPWKESLL